MKMFLIKFVNKPLNMDKHKGEIHHHHLSKIFD